MIPWTPQSLWAALQESNEFWQGLTVDTYPSLFNVTDPTQAYTSATVSFYDNHEGRNLKYLSDPARRWTLEGYPIHVQPSFKPKPASMCHRCQHWGHSHPNCFAATPLCVLCGGKHTVNDHNQYSLCCTNVDKTNSPGYTCTHARKCANCRLAHEATDPTCKFALLKFKKHELAALYLTRRSKDGATVTQKPRRPNTPKGKGAPTPLAPPLGHKPHVPTAPQSNKRVPTPNKPHSTSKSTGLRSPTYPLCPTRAYTPP